MVTNTLGENMVPNTLGRGVSHQPEIIQFKQGMKYTFQCRVMFVPSDEDLNVNLCRESILFL